MTIQTSSANNGIDLPVGVAYDVGTGKAVALGMELYTPDYAIAEAGSQWHLRYLGDIAKVWQDYTGKGVSVGVYDEGVQTEHWDLAANYDASKELVDENGIASNLHEGAHGTAAAGLIAAARNGRGGMGVAYGASIVGINIFDGTSRSGDLIWSLSNADHFDVVNNSWCFTNLPVTASCSRGTVNGLDILTDPVAAIARDGRDGLGTIFIKAAGNEAHDNSSDALNLDRHAVTVGAYRQVDGAASSYSNSGPYLLVSAPSDDYTDLGGTGLVTTDLLGQPGYNFSADPDAPADYTDQFGGTSGATPIVSGVVALMLQANPELGWRDVRHILAASAKMPVAFDTGPVVVTLPADDTQRTVVLNESRFKLAGQDAHWNGGAMHYSNDYGYGGVDAYAATRMAEVWWLFQTPQTSVNEVHASVHANVGLTATSGTTNLDPTRLQQYNDFVNVPVSFQFEVKDNIDLEHVDLMLDYANVLNVINDGKLAFTIEAQLANAQFKLIAPDGTEAFSMLGDRAFVRKSGGDQFMLGFNGFQGVLSEGTWTLQFSTYSTYTGTFDGVQQIIANALTVDNVTMDLYGSTPTNDTIYTYTDEFFKMVAIPGEDTRRMLTDADGGNDWINAAAVTADVTISLVGGQTSYFGGQAAFIIDRASVIENVVAGDGNNTLIGNRYANILAGGRGNDVLNGGMGNDVLFGGGGANRFIFDLKSGHDTISDWAKGDIIETSKALKGVGTDGYLTIGADATVLLDGAANGNTVLLTDNVGAKLQALGQKDGYFWYAYVADAAATAGKLIQEFAGHPGATAAGLVDQIVASVADANVSSDTGTYLGVHDAHTADHGIDSSFYLYDTMIGSMSGGVQLYA